MELVQIQQTSSFANPPKHPASADLHLGVFERCQNTFNWSFHHIGNPGWVPTKILYDKFLPIQKIMIRQLYREQQDTYVKIMGG